VRRLDLNVGWNLDMKALGASGFGTGTLDLILDMQVNLKDFNTAQPIVKPERATIVPLNTLIPTAPKT
jgi:hypothetical protein